MSQVIEQKYRRKECPINLEAQKLNYLFSAYLNTVQSLKDASQTVVALHVKPDKMADLERETFTA
jgi:hypothetical protein